MKKTTVKVRLLGETYLLSGRPEIIREAVRSFTRALETIRRENGEPEVSTHRLGVMAGLALAVEITALRLKKERRLAVLEKARRRLKNAARLLQPPE
ncbi:MAG TPA: cell division protein ZapA [bacterium]|nr:cell division protein ZapA [bacterium]HNS48615.1 cell division protein ZapA [bacterium]